MNDFLMRKMKPTVATGQDIGQDYVRASGYRAEYRKFTDGLGLICMQRAINALLLQISGGLDMILKPGQENDRPTSLIVSPQQNRDEKETLSRPSMPINSEPRDASITEGGHAVSKQAKTWFGRVLELVKYIFRSALQVQSERDCSTYLERDPLIMNIAQYFIDMVERGEDSMRKELVEGGEAAVPTELVFGLELQFNTGESWLWKDGTTPNPTNGRLRALQFANEIRRAGLDFLNNEARLNKSRNAQHEVMDDLEKWLIHLDRFTRTKRFDVYYQLPWTFGKQMVWMLTQATYHGAKVANSRNLFGAVFHAYNMAQKICPSMCPRLPLLEAFLDIFGNAIFMGKTRPTRNFRSIPLRYQGGRLATIEEQRKARRGQGAGDTKAAVLVPQLEEGVKRAN